jgi:hypothetical protein
MHYYEWGECEKMNKKMVSFVLVSSLLVLWLLSPLFIVVEGAVPAGFGVEENCLVKQDCATVASLDNRQYSSLRGDGDGISITDATELPGGFLEFYYDDGTAEVGYYWTGAGGKFAVRFTPLSSGQLMECKFYIYNNPDTIKVHVLDTNKNDMITPFSETPTSIGWYDVDLSSYGITVNSGVDFYVAMESTVANQPSIGTDTSSPDGRSWAHNKESWSQMEDRDYMIRAVIKPLADLKITDVYWEPSEPRSGDDVTLKADVENQGSEDATDFLVELYLDEELTASGTFSLTAGANDTYWKADPWTATFGNHTVRWVIDTTDVIDETNEDNNEMSKELIIGCYLTVGSPYGTPGGQDWYDNGTNAYATLDTGTVDYGNGTRRVFTHWSGDASGTNYAQSDPIYMNGSKTATANWKTQYYLTVDSAQGTTGGAGWYDSDTNAYATVTPLTVSGPAGTQYVFTQWTGDASGATSPSNPITMDAPKTATANWKTQYYLTVSANFGTATPSSSWYDAGLTAQISASANVGYFFDHWMLDGANAGTANPISVTINSNHTLQAVFSPSTISLTIVAGTGGRVSPSGAQTLNINQTYQFNANPNSGYEFDHWDLNGQNKGSTSPLTLTVTIDMTGQTLTALFKVLPTPTPTPSTPTPTPPPTSTTPTPTPTDHATPTPTSTPSSSPSPSPSPSSHGLSLPMEVIYAAVGAIVIVVIAVAVIVFRKRQNRAGTAPIPPPPPPPPAEAVAPQRLEPTMVTSGSHIFISHVVEDAGIAAEIANGLEKAGYKAWYYERDSVGGLSYLLQTMQAIERSQAVILLISPNSLSSNQVTKEVVRTHEAGKPFIPLLYGISHVEFQQRQPEWREAIGSATSISIPKEGVSKVLPRIIDGLARLGAKKK